MHLFRYSAIPLFHYSAIPLFRFFSRPLFCSSVSCSAFFVASIMHMALKMQKVKPSAIICHAHNNFTSDHESIIMLCLARFSSTVCLHMLVHT